MKALIIIATALCATGAFATYSVEWSASLSYSAATCYTSNKAYSYDITGDSIPEVFVMDSSALKVFNGVTHNLIWSIPLSYQYGGYPIVCKTDGGASKKVVFSAYSYSSGYTGRFYVYDCATHNQEYVSPVKTGYPPSVSVADVDGDGKSEICCVSGNANSRILEVYGSDAVGVDEGRKQPATSGFAVPNPARRFVELNVAAATGCDVVTICDITGRVIRRLPVPGRGAAIIWDCCDDAGQPVPVGSYLFRCGASSGRVAVVRD